MKNDEMTGTTGGDQRTRSRGLLALWCIAIAFSSGCASLQPPMATPFAGFRTAVERCEDKADKTERQLCEARQHVRDLDAKHFRRAQAVQKEMAFYFDLPLIAIATAVAAATLFEAHRDTIAGLGLGAAALGGVRTYANPAVQLTTYDSINAALKCVLTTSEVFVDSSSDLKTLTADVNKLRNRSRLERALASLSAADSAARDAVTAALSAASSAVAVGGPAIAAITGAPQSIVDAADAIDKRGIERLRGARASVTEVTAAIDTYANTTVAARSSADSTKKSADAGAFHAARAARGVSGAADNAIALSAEFSATAEDVSKIAPKYVEAKTALAVCIAKVQ